MTDMTRKLALVCTVSVLTLGLAACNSTGTKTPAGGQPGSTPTPPAGQGDTSELGKARTAAKTAMDAAKTASDGAETQAGNAETAVMGLALIQTGDPMAKKKAMEAREAARKAMEAYEKAKAESAKAAAATTITAAVTARRAAEAARAEAVKQQMAAAVAAKAATDAAAKEVKVTYDDNGKATVSVGDTKIVAGSPKVETTTGGVKVTTGKRGDLVERAQTYARYGDDRAYRAAVGDTPERAGKAKFRGRVFNVGSYTDSEKSRLFLIDKYVSNTKAVKVYKEKIGSAAFSAPITAQNPFGSRTVDDKTYKIMRAEGEFYVLTGNELTKLDKTNVNENWVDVKPDANAGVGVYYYMNGSTKTYLVRTGTDGTDKWQYREILVYDVTDWPDVRPYEHMNFGAWNKKEPADRTDLGTAFVTALPDGEGVTPVAGMPNFGKATYRGHATWQRRAQHAEGKGSIGAPVAASATTVADFGKNTIRTDLFRSLTGRLDRNEGYYRGIFATLHGTIDGNGFSGTRVTNVNAEGAGYNSLEITQAPGDTSATRTLHRNNVSIAPSADGKLYQVKEYRGNFFGPNAEEVGGVFDVTSEGKKNGEFRGSFGGRKVEAE